MVYSDRIRLLNPALPERQPLYCFGYAIDPDPVMSCPKLRPAARLVYRAVLRLCGRGTGCRASVEQIASQAGVSVRSVQRHISILTDRDLIETEEEPGSPTIFRLLPLPDWITEGRRPVLVNEETTRPDALGPVVSGPVVSGSSAPEGRQPDGGGVTACQGRGDSLSPPMDNKEHERENPISLSGLGSDSGTRWTDQPSAPEREGVGEGNDHVTTDHKTTRPKAHQVSGPVVGGPVVPAPPTPHQIVRQTWEVLGLHPTRAQVSLGLRDVADLCADGFSLWEIEEGARYAAEQGWVRSFAGVKFYLPQALNALEKKDHRTTDHRTTDHKTTSPQVSGPVVSGPVVSGPVVSGPDFRRQTAEESPHRELWEQVRGKIATRIQRQSYQTWFEPACIGDFDGQRVVLNVSSHFFSDWMEEHYLELLEATFEEVLGHRVEVAIETPGGGG